MASGSAATFSLKLVIDTKGKRVLYDESGKDFVDFVFNILSLPLSTVTRILSKQNMLGCLGDLYGSVETLSDTLMESATRKDALLKPRVVNYAPSASFMVMDDLVVKPLSTASIMSLLAKSSVKDVVAIEEREIQFAINEGLKLLKMCLQSKTVLTDLFLRENVVKNEVNNPLAG
ncbi:hypothetical protein COLO4_10939 [Corchorus olitorius]|uniref:DUF674 domain-containing protein n=1 Tax=Corchorus olitorius TaxID=93759 RepID=A0A1R3K6Q0_9ROSI|nr:hypothetical protein COLO4_10939 [Corchorus olitorius]